MASLRCRDDTGTLFFDFRWDGKRYRAATDTPDTPEGRRSLEAKLKQVNAALKAGTFSLATFFPELEPPKLSEHAPEPTRSPTVQGAAAATHAGISFNAFAEQWFNEFKVGWRKTYVITVRGILDQHLLPRFGTQELASVNRTMVLELRAHLADARGRRPGTKLSPARINTIMLILRQILQEGADRYQFTMPMQRLRPLKVPKSDAMPFTLDETHLIISSVRKDYRNYVKVRFFTGMRSGEINGLKWKYVDFDRRLILVRESFVGGEEDYTKTDSSQRDIPMSNVVYEALREQHKATGQMTFVFCNRAGVPVDTNNFTKRVWYPLLRHLKLPLRRPYQTRHTAATLWLAAGESPAWVATVLGHSSQEMLWRTYARFIPNLTRQDGSAMDRMLNSVFKPATGGDGSTPPAQPPPARARLLAA